MYKEMHVFNLSLYIYIYRERERQRETKKSRLWSLELSERASGSRRAAAPILCCNIAHYTIV